MPTLTEPEFRRRIADYVERIHRNDDLTLDDHLEIARLWNTLGNDERLRRDPVSTRFFELVRDDVTPRMIDALQMETGRGYALHSTTHDMVLGGVLDERHRYLLAAGSEE